MEYTACKRMPITNRTRAMIACLGIKKLAYTLGSRYKPVYNDYCSLFY